MRHQRWLSPSITVPDNVWLRTTKLKQKLNNGTSNNSAIVNSEIMIKSASPSENAKKA